MGKEFKSYLYIIFGVLTIAVSINSFYSPNGMVSGGVSGLGIIFRYYSEVYLDFEIPISITNIVLNVPLFILAYKAFGSGYIRRSAIATGLLSIMLQLTVNIPTYVGDIMLASIFGGIFIGIGVGFVMNGWTTTGGTETLAHLIYASNNRFSVSNYIFFIDAAIIIIGLFAFGAEKAMYAIISVFVSSRMISIISSGIALEKAAFIVSDKYCEISDEISIQLGRKTTSLTNYNFGKASCLNTLICVFSQNEISQIKEIVKTIDKYSFIILFDIKEVYGEGFRKL